MAIQAILFDACGILFDVYSIPHVTFPGKGGYGYSGWTCGDAVWSGEFSGRPARIRRKWSRACM